MPVNRPPDDDLERYLDAKLSGEDSRAIGSSQESSAESDERFRGELDRQRAIDESLRRTFAPPSKDEVLRRIELERLVRHAATTDARPSVIKLRWLAMAASFACVVVGAWLIWMALGIGRPQLYQTPPWQSFETAYHDKIARGFEPLWVCDTDEEFAETFDVQFRQPIVLGELPEGVKALGLDYCHSLSPVTTCVLVKAGKDPIVVFVDHIERDSVQPEQTPGGLNVFRRQAGRLVLYEVSPLDQPKVLEHFSIPSGTSPAGG